MKLCRFALALLAVLLFSGMVPAPLAAQSRGGSGAPVAAEADSGFGPLDPAPPTGLTANQLIDKFAARESVFEKAQHEYGFRQNVKMQTLDENHKVDGEYQQTTDISYDKDGKRVENVIFAPANTLTRVIISEQDLTDIKERLTFAITTVDLPDYDITYLGRQKVDDLDTYVFQAGPTVMEKGRRYFQGKIWIDQQGYQVVLIDGKNVPDNMQRGHEDLSLPFTTYYEPIDGDYWFPTYTKGEGVLNTPGGRGYMSESIHLRQIVTYSNYKRFGSKSRILFNGKDVTDQRAPDGSQPAKP